MHVFVTGATGFVGTAVVDDLLKAGHRVTGLARSDAAEKSLQDRGAKAHRGDLTDLESLRKGAADCEGIIHTGFVHDFANFKESCAIEERALDAIGAVLKGSSRKLIITSGTALVSPGQIAREDMIAPKPRPEWPRASEEIATRLREQGVKTAIVRLSPSVHGDGDHAFIPILINLAREKGVSAYVGEGSNRWTAVHRLDAGPLFRLALEKAEAGDSFHGVAEEAIRFKEIAQTIGQKLKLPVVSKSAAEAPAHFGWFAGFASIDCPASNELTRKKLGWKPVQVSLIDDLKNGKYFSVT